MNRQIILLSLVVASLVGSPVLAESAEKTQSWTEYGQKLAGNVKNGAENTMLGVEARWNDGVHCASKTVFNYFVTDAEDSNRSPKIRVFKFLGGATAAGLITIAVGRSIYQVACKAAPKVVSAYNSAYNSVIGA